MAPEPFRVDVPQSDIDDLRARVERARWPEAGLDGQGIAIDRVRGLAQRWIGAYEWRAAEAALNAWPQFTTTVDGQRIHFLHVRSEHDDALPVVLTHGWPGAVTEFLRAIPSLRDFHLVIPALPGYGWSGPTHEGGWGPKRIASSWIALMDELGYGRFGVQGGDWGSIVSQHVAALAPERVVGAHLNMLTIGPPGNADDFDDMSERELANRAHARDHKRHGTGYREIQGTRPQTLGYGLDDSPVGLLAWIAEKLDEWTGVTVADDDVLTIVSTYWFSRTATSAARLYWEMRNGGDGVPPSFGAPLGVSWFVDEVMPRRRWVEARYDLRQWTEHDRGGHFAALEMPDVFAADVRAFFSSVTPTR